MVNGRQQLLLLPNAIIMYLLFVNSSWLKKKFLQLRLRDTKSTKSLLELTAKLFLSKAQRWFLQYFWPLLGLSGWPSAMQNSKKKIILQWKKETFIWEPVCSRVKRAERDGDALPESQIKVNWLGEKLFITFGGLGTWFTWHQIEPYNILHRPSKNCQKCKIDILRAL